MRIKLINPDQFESVAMVGENILLARLDEHTIKFHRQAEGWYVYLRVFVDGALCYVYEPPHPIEVFDMWDRLVERSRPEPTEDPWIRKFMREGFEDREVIPLPQPQGD